MSNFIDIAVFVAISDNNIELVYVMWNWSLISSGLDIFAVGPWCFINPKMTQTYQGNINVTATGKPCQSWDAQQPHEHSIVAESLPEGSLEDAGNFCRDPGRLETWPWCYTMTSTRWEFCSVRDIVCRMYEIKQILMPVCGYHI